MLAPPEGRRPLLQGILDPPLQWDYVMTLCCLATSQPVMLASRHHFSLFSLMYKRVQNSLVCVCVTVTTKQQPIDAAMQPVACLNCNSYYPLPSWLAIVSTYYFGRIRGGVIMLKHPVYPLAPLPYMGMYPVNLWEFWDACQCKVKGLLYTGDIWKYYTGSILSSKGKSWSHFIGMWHWLLCLRSGDVNWAPTHQWRFLNLFIQCVELFAFLQS